MRKYHSQSRTIRSFFTALVLCIGLPTVVTAADVMTPAATTATTKPAPLKPTPEQAALIRETYSKSLDTPVEKLDLRVAKPDGTPNDHFGQPDKHFIDKHAEFLKRGKSGPIGVLFLGDSITEGWNGSGKAIWAERYGKLDPANFGIGGDGTPHVLWRIANGELDGISPKVVVFMLGTNNSTSAPEKILAADTKIIQQIHEKLPDTKVLVLGIFPRGADPSTNAGVAAVREKLKTVNAGLAKLDDGNKTRYLDIGDKFLTPDGVLTPQIMPDALHPNAKGYQIWADAMQPLLDEMLK